MTATTSNRQKRYRENKLSAGDRHLTCWLGYNDNQRLMRLMNSLGYLDRGKTQTGYTNVISLALAQLEQQLEKPSQPLRYGLVMLNENRQNNV